MNADLEKLAEEWLACWGNNHDPDAMVALTKLLARVRREALEEAAALCDAKVPTYFAAREEQYEFEQLSGTHNAPLRAMYTDKADEAKECGDAIRALLENERNINTKGTDQ